MRFGLAGTITSAGFASGDRFVVGDWTGSPIGPFSDVMWAQPSGQRVLLGSSSLACEFISAVYRFDSVGSTGVSATRHGRSLSVHAGPVELEMIASSGWRVPGGRLRPLWWHRFVEAPVARAAMGVRVYGASPEGVFEWYRADVYRALVSASASVEGRDLGVMGPLQPACRFGFSEPPRRPSMVEVRPLLFDPSARLDAVVSRATAHGLLGVPATSATPSDRR